MNDPIVEKVRKLRDKHAKKFDYNLEKICENIRKKHNKNIETLKKIKAGVKVSS